MTLAACHRAYCCGPGVIFFLLDKGKLLQASIRSLSLAVLGVWATPEIFDCVS